VRKRSVCKRTQPHLEQKGVWTLGPQSDIRVHGVQLRASGPSFAKDDCHLGRPLQAENPSLGCLTRALESRSTPDKWEELGTLKVCFEQEPPLVTTDIWIASTVFHDPVRELV